MVSAEALFNYLTQGDFYNFFIQLLNYYFPYGLFFWLVGLMLFIVIQLKTKTTLYSLMVTTIYFVVISNTGLVVNVWAREVMRWVGMGLTLMLGYEIYLAIKGRA